MRLSLVVCVIFVVMCLISSHHVSVCDAIIVRAYESSITCSGSSQSRTGQRNATCEIGANGRTSGMTTCYPNGQATFTIYSDSQCTLVSTSGTVRGDGIACSQLVQSAGPTYGFQVDCNSNMATTRNTISIASAIVSILAIIETL